MTTDRREARLDEIRRQAESFVPAASANLGYYGVPLLKPPVWTWEVPAYFFVGGAAGAAAAVGAMAQLTGADGDLVRDARWIAAAGAAASTPLLIADLGRPERFLNMLRVFKLQSPMSVGAWTLAAFGTAASAAAFADVVQRRTRLPVAIVGDAAAMLSAATGVVMSTYTGVLIGATAIPAWSRNVTLLPVAFGASALGAAVSLLELRGHGEKALNFLGLGAAAVESVIAYAIETSRERATEPLRTGVSGRLMRTAAILSGPLPLALRLAGLRSKRARNLAAALTLAGSLLTRFAWVEAGRASARDPREPLDLP